MTQARPPAPGLGNPPLIPLLLEAVACAFVCLVETVRATFGMRFRHQPRDWHMVEMREALPQTKPGTHLKEITPPTESLSGLSRASLLDNPKGLANDPVEALNRESRDKPENDLIGVPMCVLMIVPAVVLVGVAPRVIPAVARKRVRNNGVCASEISLI